MRKSFERNIFGYKELAKDELKLRREDKVEEKGLADLQKIIDWHINKATQERKSDLKEQEKIYEIQKEKQLIMDNLKKDLAKLDQPSQFIEWGKNAQVVIFKDNNSLIEMGTGKPITVGEILSDYSWGVNYYLGKNVPRDIKKKYLIERARFSLQKLLDKQITLDEVASSFTGEGIKHAYQEKAAQESKGNLGEGIIAELMVQNFFKKISLDFEVDFQVMTADVFQDVTQKIDFIISRKLHKRGVGVEEKDSGDIGVQFTINTSREKIEHKEKQLEKARQILKHKKGDVDDYVLVSIPLKETRSLYQRWQNKKTPGGPDKLWSMTTKEQVFRSVLKGILTEKEIDENWRAVAKTLK